MSSSQSLEPPNMRPYSPNERDTPSAATATPNSNSTTTEPKESNGSAGGIDSKVLDQLNSQEAKTLLDTVDSLRALHVGDIVQLPQIIVVGDQSAGKSSVLEAISRVKFPTKGGLCTRFATELVLRRSISTSASVKIIRAHQEAQKDATRATFERKHFDTKDLPTVVEEAKVEMGLGEEGSEQFSKDILRVEVSGPNVHPLTLVDLPGFYQSPVQGQTDEGKVLVDQLAASYMKQKNSIILAVVSANYQITVQRVLSEVKMHDPDMKRTLGIVTKPDLPQPGSDDQLQAIHLASGQDSLNRLPLGWHVLRNRSELEDDEQGKQRDTQEEEFFQTGNWAVIPHKDRGAAKLREKLSKVLLGHIQRSLPGLISDIEKHLTKYEEELGRLGAERSRPEDLRSFLVEVAVKFERLARDAVNGYYKDDFFGKLHEEERKLRSLLRNLNKAFSITLQEKGSAMTIIWPEDENSGDESTSAGIISRAMARTFNSAANDHQFADTDYHLSHFLRLYDFPQPSPISEDFMRAKVDFVAAMNQGKEFPGSVNPDLAMDFFKQQSAPWERIAQRHLKLVSDYCLVFVERLFQYIIGRDAETLESLLRIRVDAWFATKRMALEDKLQELLRPYKAGYGVALEQEMLTRTESRSVKRLLKQMEKVVAADQTLQNSGLSPTKLFEGLTRDGNPVNRQFGTDRILDLMMEHYEMSLRTFTDNVVNLAVESCLVDAIQTILTPQAVNRMSDEELVELAGESEDVKVARQKLMQQVATLKSGLAKCERYRPRSMTTVPKIPAQTPEDRNPEARKEVKVKLPSVAVASPSSTPTPRPFSGGIFSPPKTNESNVSPANSTKAPASGLFGGLTTTDTGSASISTAKWPTHGLFGQPMPTNPVSFPTPTTNKSGLFSRGTNQAADSASSSKTNSSSLFFAPTTT